VIKIALHHVPGPEPMARLMHQGAAELAAKFPSILSFRLAAERLTDQDTQQVSFEIHVELLFAEHQIILNRVAATPEAALRDTLAAANIEIERLALRDPSVAPALPAIRTVRPMPLAA
jgi:hypothetical protein